MSSRWFTLFAFLLLLGCSNNSQETIVSTPLTVDFSYQPSELKQGEVATLQILVKQGSDFVADSKDVKFEIWKDGQDKHELVDAESKGKGVYTAREIFQDPGMYHVMYHVTARGMHSMKAQELQVK